jgi:hypothetical protein
MPHRRKSRTEEHAHPASPTDEQIMARAYEIYLERGQTPGDAVADWLQAERELNALASAAAAEPKPQRARPLVYHEIESMIPSHTARI